MVQHYFASAWLLADGVQRDNFVRKVGDNLYAVGMITPWACPGEPRPWMRACSPARRSKRCWKPGPGLELVKDYGWLTILAKPLYWLLDQMHSVLGNWGWSIVAWCCC
jgi:YidC/Oxa1 family membrane protein insertase